MDPFERYLLIAYKYLSYHSRSEKEIRDKLESKNAPLVIIDRVIQQLLQQRFINDEELARMWITSRKTLKPKSQRLLTIELKRKGISKEVIDKVQNEMKLDKEDDLLSARLLVKRKLSKYSNLPRQEIYQKLGGFLGRRGFNWEIIKKAIDEEIKVIE